MKGGRTARTVVHHVCWSAEAKFSTKNRREIENHQQTDYISKLKE